ncbi:MAG: hypothetical protein ACE5JL_14460, partial [Dehalococcoidia bacterium]
LMLRWIAVATLGGFIFWSSSLSYLVLHDFLPPARCAFARLAEPPIVVFLCGLAPTLDFAAMIAAVVGVVLIVVALLGSWRSKKQIQGQNRRPVGHPGDGRK